MDLYERFSMAFASAEVELTTSLPICNKECEILFFYSIGRKKGQDNYFGAIHHAYKRNNKDGMIVDITDQLKQSDIYGACKGCLLQPTILDENAYEKEELYETQYEEFYKQMITGETNEDFSELCGELLDCFYELVPRGQLRDMYEALGKEYFDCLRAASHKA